MLQVVKAGNGAIPSTAEPCTGTPAEPHQGTWGRNDHGVAGEHEIAGKKRDKDTINSEEEPIDAREERKKEYDSGKTKRDVDEEKITGKEKIKAIQQEDKQTQDHTPREAANDNKNERKIKEEVGENVTEEKGGEEHKEERKEPKKESVTKDKTDRKKEEKENEIWSNTKEVKEDKEPPGEGRETTTKTEETKQRQRDNVPRERGTSTRKEEQGKQEGKTTKDREIKTRQSKINEPNENETKDQREIQENKERRYSKDRKKHEEKKIREESKRAIKDSEAKSVIKESEEKRAIKESEEKRAIKESEEKRAIKKSEENRYMKESQERRAIKESQAKKSTKESVDKKPIKQSEENRASEEKRATKEKEERNAIKASQEIKLKKEKEERRRVTEKLRVQESRRRRLNREEEKRGGGRSRRLKGSYSTLDLPAAVTECFQDPSLLSSLQARLLTLLGRGRRYRLKRPSLHPVMSLEALRRKVKEAKLLLLPPPPSSPPPTTADTSLFPSTHPPSPSTTVFRAVTDPDMGGGVYASLTRYWGGEGEREGGEDEAELLQQYLSLQQLAISRKHSAQLRKIRDSLVNRRVRSRPCSIIGSPAPIPANSGHSLGHTQPEGASLSRLHNNISNFPAQSLNDIAQVCHNSTQSPDSPAKSTETTSDPDNDFQRSQNLTQPSNHTQNNVAHIPSPHSTPNSHTRGPESPILSPNSAQVSPVPSQNPANCSRGRPHHARPPSTQVSSHHAQTPRSDRQQLRDFLLDVGFVQYYNLLNRHGYDLPTAAHMDALDLAGAGITEPLHRMALKFELDLVKQPPKVPEDVPETIEEWLGLLSLQDYTENFHQNGLYCPLAAVGLTKRDLQLMGVYMQGHRKKILLALAGLTQALFRKE